MTEGFITLRGLSWLPYNAFCKIRDSGMKANEVCVDLREYGVNKKFRLSLPTGDSGLSRQLRIFGFREPLNCRCYVNFVDENDVLLDIGANIGFFVMLGSRAKKIVCVEPLTNVIELLQSNIRLNELPDKCTIVNAAVGPKGKLLLEINAHLNLSKIVQARNENTIEVDSIPLRDLVKEHSANAIRLDVEGFEYDLLHNQIPDSVNKISMEFHTELMGKDKSSQLLKYLKDEGFQLRFFVEDVPLRLYPIVHITKNPSILRFISYIKQNLDIEDVTDLVSSGRSLKYLYLERPSPA